MTIPDALTALADDIGQVIPCTLDASLFGPLVTEYGCAAMVGMPTIAAFGLRGQLHLEIPLFIAVTGQGLVSDFVPVWAAIDQLVPSVLGVIGPLRPDRVPGLGMPCYTTTAQRRA